MSDGFNPFSLKRKKILVTGASSGIGKSISEICAKMGATIYATGRNEHRLFDMLSSLPDGEHNAIPGDLTCNEDIERIVSELPKLDGIVHCAGVGNRIPCKQVTQIDIDYVMKLNVEAPMLLQASLQKNKRINPNSSIVFIASRAAYAPSMGNAIYSASKGAILSYAKCLALELAHRKIRVNSICPAMVLTDLIFQNGFSKEDVENVQTDYPLKRFGKPEDISFLSVYLLSDASSWMTGSVIDITGGGEGLLTL